MSDLSKYIKLKNNVDSAQQKKDRAEGALSQVMKRLKAELGCSTLDEANKKLTEVMKKAAKSIKTFNKAIEGFEEEFEDELDE